MYHECGDITWCESCSPTELVQSTCVLPWRSRLWFCYAKIMSYCFILLLNCTPPIMPSLATNGVPPHCQQPHARTQAHIDTPHARTHTDTRAGAHTHRHTTRTHTHRHRHTRRRAHIDTQTHTHTHTHTHIYAHEYKPPWGLKHLVSFLYHSVSFVILGNFKSLHASTHTFEHNTWIPASVSIFTVIQTGLNSK